MVWQYSLAYISQEDYHSIAYPKKQALGFCAIWTGFGLLLNQKYLANPEIIYKKFLFTPLSIFFVAIPVGVSWYLVRK